jgi:hypothetical protein
LARDENKVKRKVKKGAKASDDDLPFKLSESQIVRGKIFPQFFNN